MRWKRIWREIVPAPDAEEDINPNGVFRGYSEALKGLTAHALGHSASRLFQVAQSLFNEEEQRRTKLETAATNMLNALSVMGAFVVGFGGVLLTQQRATAAFVFAVGVTYVVALLYLIGAYLVCLGVLAYEERFSADPIDLLPQSTTSQDGYELHLTRIFLGYTIENYKVNNRQVHRLRLARLLLRNAVVVLLVGGVLLGFSLVSSMLVEAALKSHGL